MAKHEKKPKGEGGTLSNKDLEKHGIVGKYKPLGGKPAPDTQANRDAAKKAGEDFDKNDPKK